MIFDIHDAQLPSTVVPSCNLVFFFFPADAPFFFARTTLMGSGVCGRDGSSSTVYWGNDEADCGVACPLGVPETGCDRGDFGANVGISPTLSTTNGCGKDLALGSRRLGKREGSGWEDMQLSLEQ